MALTRGLAVGLTPLETRRDVILEVATHAERLGYEAVYVAEGWGHDVTVLLADVASRTSAIRIGTGVLNVWGRSAATIAMAAGTLDEVSGGRFVLGLGAGSPQLAEGLHDVPFQEPTRRLAETTRQVRRLLAGERLAPSGPGGAAGPVGAAGSGEAAGPGRAAGLRLATRPRPGVPIHLAGLGPASTRVAGELADGWYPFLLPRSAVKDRARLLAHPDGARARPTVCPGIPAAVTGDPGTDRQVAAWWLSFYLTSMGPLYRRTLRELGFGAAVDSVLAANPGRGPAVLPPDAAILADELTLRGDRETARADLDRWYGAGADTPVVVLPPNRAPDELISTLETLAP